MEPGLYAQVVKLRQKYLKWIAENKNKNEAKFKFQGQSARSQRCFDLGFDCIELSFITCETDFYKKFFHLSKKLLKNQYDYTLYFLMILLCTNI